LLPPTVQSPSAARAFTRETLAHWRLNAWYDEIALIVNELVTNALIHAGGAITLELHRLDQSVRAVVADDSVALPTERPPEIDRESGRGLHLVAAFARAWGTYSVPSGGKAVWAEIKIPPMIG
jgi:anti-sigma regulatory factor (Ser/Thr protein kinase)